MPKRRRREYLQLLDAAKAAIESAVDEFNRVRNPYRNEATLLLMSNAWELFAKSILVQMHESIAKGKDGDTIPAKVAIIRLKNHKLLDGMQAATIQQVLSLRDAAAHHLLPEVPDEVMHHLLFYGCKFFRDLMERVFPRHAKDLSDNYLSLSFSDLTTYAGRVQKAVSRVRKSQNDKRLIWLLERGIEFDGSAYLTEKQFEQKFQGKSKIMPHLSLSGFVRSADMVRVVPIQAPRNFTADITLRKGSAKDASLPVVVKRTDVEADYPYLTRELGQKVGKELNWTAKAAVDLKMKGDQKYHDSIRTSRTGSVHRYSEAALQKLKEVLRQDPQYDPWGRRP